MSRLEECKQDISKMYWILMGAIVTYDYCYYFHDPATSEEKKFLDANRHMRWIRHELYRMTIIDLAKLVTDSPNTHKYNFFKLFRKLSPNGDYCSLGVASTQIAEWESRLYRHDDTINRIRLLRDKIYSHTDRLLPGTEDLELDFTEIAYLLTDLKEVFFDLGEKTIRVGHSFRNPYFERGSFDMIKVLAGHH